MTNVADSLLNVIFLLLDISRFWYTLAFKKKSKEYSSGQLMLPVLEIKMASEKKNVDKTVFRRMEIILKIFIFNT